MAYQNIEVKREERIAILTINRPEVHNALSDATTVEIGNAFDEFAVDDNVRAVIVTGAGTKSFAAGADINEFLAVKNPQDASRKLDLIHEALRKIETFSKPVIIAINGYALGGGTELALAGDFRIAADTAKMGLTEINLGLFPGGGGTQRLPRLVGRSTAKWMIFSGELVTADEALRIGLVDRVVPAGELMEFAKGFATKLASKAPVALALAKKSIDEGAEVDLDRALVIEKAYNVIATTTEDCQEGTSAFLQKRKPEWKGR